MRFRNKKNAVYPTGRTILFIFRLIKYSDCQQLTAERQRIKNVLFLISLTLNKTLQIVG